MSKLLLNPTPTAQYYSLVNEAEVACSRQLDEELESYLVFLLMRFEGKPEMVGSILALEFLHGLSKPGKLRLEILKEVGDKCLLLSGLFPDRIKRRRVRESYFIDLGQNAYYFLANQSSSRLASLYIALCEQFIPMREVLAAMRSYQESNRFLQH